MGRHTNSQHIDAPPEVAFDLWTNLDRQREWIGGVTDVVDVTGPAGRRRDDLHGDVRPHEEPNAGPGGRAPATLRGPFRQLDPPWPEQRDVRARRRRNAHHRPPGHRGLFPAIMAWIFSLGSWKGSFRGELAHFARLAEIDARRASRTCWRIGPLTLRGPPDSSPGWRRIRGISNRSPMPATAANAA